MLIDVFLYCNVKCDEMSCSFVFCICFYINRVLVLVLVCVRLEKWIFVFCSSLSLSLSDSIPFFQNKMNVPSISYEIVSLDNSNNNSKSSSES